MRSIFRKVHIGRLYKNEFKKQIRNLIILTLGFTIAFAWRQTTFDISQSIIQYFFKNTSSPTSSILTSTFITIISIGIILLTSYWFRKTYDY